MRHLRTAISFGTASAVVLGAALAAPASAGDVATLSESDIMSSLMRISDIPGNVRSLPTQRGLRSGPTRTTAYLTGSEAIPPDICVSKKGNDVNGTKPLTSGNAEIALTAKSLKATNTSTNNNIYNYGTAAKASSAWNNLVQTASKCNGSKTVTKKAGGKAFKIRIDMKFARTTYWRGNLGFSLAANVSAKIGAQSLDLKILGDQFAAYRLVGPTIERVEFARISLAGTSVGINKKRRAFVTEETDRVAQRIWRRWTN